MDPKNPRGETDVFSSGSGSEEALDFDDMHHTEVYGGLIAVPNNHVLEEVSDGYSGVEVSYQGDSRARIRAKSQEKVEEFVSDYEEAIEAGVDYGETQHPESSIMNDAEFSVVEALEEKPKATDGGRKASSQKMAGIMGPETKGPDSDYVTDGGGVNEETQLMGDITHSREDQGYENGAPW